MYSNKYLRAYREADLTSIGKEKMVVLLYEKMLEHFREAETAARAGKRAEMSRRLSLAQRITIELRNALDHAVGGDIARSLCSLYDFVFQECLAMLVDRDPEHAVNCARVLDPLLGAWRQIPPGTAQRMARQLTACSGADPATVAFETRSAPRPPAAPPDSSPAEVSRLISVSV